MYLSCYLCLFTCIISVCLCFVTSVFLPVLSDLSLSISVLLLVSLTCIIPVCPLLVTCVFLPVFSLSVSVLLPVFSLYVSVLLPVSFTCIIPVWLCLVTCVFYLYYSRMPLSCYLCLLPVLSPYDSLGTFGILFVSVLLPVLSLYVSVCYLGNTFLSQSFYVHYPCMTLSL